MLVGVCLSVRACLIGYMHSLGCLSLEGRPWALMTHGRDGRAGEREIGIGWKLLQGRGCRSFVWLPICACLVFNMKSRGKLRIILKSYI